MKKATNGTPPRPTGTQAIERAALLLREVSAQNREGVRLVDLAARVKLEKPTIHRILRSLAAEGFVAQDPETRRYFLGQTLFEFGLAAAHRFSIRDLSQASLARIAQVTEDTVFLSIRSGTDTVCVERLDGTFPIKVFTLSVGDRRPMGSGASGLAILAALPTEEARAIIAANASRMAAFGGATTKAMLERVARTQEQGYALHDVAAVTGFRAVGMAIRDPGGYPVAGISISAMADRIQGKRKDRLVELLRAETQAIEKLLRRQSEHPRRPAQRPL